MRSPGANNPTDAPVLSFALPQVFTEALPRARHNARASPATPGARPSRSPRRPQSPHGLAQKRRFTHTGRASERGHGWVNACGEVRPRGLGSGTPPLLRPREGPGGSRFPCLSLRPPTTTRRLMATDSASFPAAQVEGGRGCRKDRAHGQVPDPCRSGSPVGVEEPGGGGCRGRGGMRVRGRGGWRDRERTGYQGRCSWRAERQERSPGGQRVLGRPPRVSPLLPVAPGQGQRHPPPPPLKSEPPDHVQGSTWDPTMQGAPGGQRAEGAK